MAKDRLISRRRFLRTSAASSVAAGDALAASQLLVSAQQARQGVPDGVALSPPLVLVNGRIHTLDARNTTTNTVTIRNGRFETVGNSSQREAAAPNAQDKDL